VFTKRLSPWPLLLLLLRITSAQNQVNGISAEGLFLQSDPSLKVSQESGEAFVERDFTFSSRGTQVGATLCLPLKIEGKVPVLVFLPEPGPSEFAGSFPFVNLAHMVAQVGIASLRYDKPALSSAANEARRMTLNEEIFEDAVAAIQFASKLSEADTSAIYLLGHGLGAALAPYVAERSNQIHGAILLAPSIMPIEYTFAREMRENLKDEGKSEAQIQEALIAQNRILADLRAGKSPNDRMVLGAPTGYWRDWMNRDLAGRLSELSLPILVLEPGRGAQSDEAEYTKLQSALNEKPPRLAEVHWFLNLNARFVPSVLQPHQAESIDLEVIESISSWIQDQTAPAPPHTK